MRRLVGTVALVSSAAPASAATTTTTIAVSATIVATCTITASTLAFGTYSTVQNDATATLTIRCTDSTTYTIGMNNGLNSVTPYDWKLGGPSTARLAYRVYRDAARTALWGNTAGGDTVGGTGNGGNQAITLYGREPAGQFVQPGSYTDTITLIVKY